MNFKEILQSQRLFFNGQHTKPLETRKTHLKTLRKAITDHQPLLYEAIAKDFGKSVMDTYTTEIAFVLSEIDYFLKNLRKLARPKRVGTNLVNLPGRSQIHKEPLGCTLIIGAWNYPYQLSLSPLVAAIAAGNTAIVKPSEVAPHTMEAIANLLNQHFPPNLIFCAQGGVETTTELLKLRFDKLFFTGSPKIGTLIYEAAAKHLTPVTLELGGKSPAIVSRHADLDKAAKRIVWGKFLNAGQTCVAPDYLLVDQSIQKPLLERLKAYITAFDYQKDSPHYTKIINEKHFDRLSALIPTDKIYHGGESNRNHRYIAPTLLAPISWDDAIMQEEIFGPLLPVLSYDSFSDALEQIRQHEKPLAAYLFSHNAEEQQRFTQEISFGGGCINDVIMHLSNPNLPFGGVGQSGIGHYHGAFGFEAFSHQKALLKKSLWGEPNLKYPPYSEKKFAWIKRFL
ncbi:aldehyde dehydrogenase [Bergeyella sp. RCAD1439]|uniref:aldehyde dehydrogenase n=1 Tax=Bergeyella anatis TaxID=3113737 RepID=UPI002E1815F9|nr:aldehyde dehydrogenase [Bergeyella sp. RCAD1439]